MKKFYAMFLVLMVILTGCSNTAEVEEPPGSLWTLETVAPEQEMSFTFDTNMKSRDGKLYFVANETIPDSLGLEYAGLYEYDPEINAVTRLDSEAEYAYVLDFDFDDDGGFVVLYSQAPIAAEAEITVAQGTREQKLSNSILERIDASGNSLWRYNITKTQWDGGNTDLAGLTAAQIFVADGMVVCMNSVLGYDDDGNKNAILEAVFAVTFDDQRLDLPVIETDVHMTHNLARANGQIYLVTQHSPYTAAALDWESLDYGQEVTISIADHAQSGMGGMLLSGDDRLLYRDSVGIWSADPVTGETEYLLNWLENDLDVSVVNSLCWLDGQLVYTDGSSDVISILTKKDGPDQRTVVTLGTLNLDSAMRQAVLNFNQANDKYRVEVIDYSQYGDAGQDKLNMDIAGDNMPDIVETSSVPYATIAGAKAKGALLDLNQLTEVQLDLSGYIPGLKKALEEPKGAMYELVTGFSLLTMAGHPEDFANGESLSWSKLLELNRELEPGQRLMEGDLELGLMMLEMDNESFMDWKTGSCDYENEEFYSALEVIKEAFPASSSVRVSDDQGSAFRSGDQALTVLELGGLAHLADYLNQLGDEAVMVGLPSAGAGGAVFVANCRLAVSAKTEELDAVLELLQYLLEARSPRQFPALESVFEDMLAEATTPLEDQPERAAVDGLHITRVTQEQAEQLRKMVAETSRIYDYDESVFDILSDEVSDHMAGKTDPATAAQRVQSRVQTYLSERG